MKIRLTLNNTIDGPLAVDDQFGGWDDFAVMYERNEDFHSLVKQCDQPLTFFDEHIAVRSYVKNIENTQGPDAQISALLELAEDDVTFQDLWNGLIKVDSIKEFDFRKIDLGLFRDDFWQRIINKRSTPVNLSATTDLYGGSRVPIVPFTLTLPGQIVDKKFQGELQEPVLLNSITDGPWTAGQFFSLGLDKIILDEFNEHYRSQKFEFSEDELPEAAFLISEDGAYTLQLKMEIVGVANSGAGNDFPAVNMGIMYRKNTDADVSLSVVNHTLMGIKSSVYTATITDDFIIGDTIRIFGVELNNPGGSGDLYQLIGSTSGVIPSGDPNPTEWVLLGETTFRDSQAPAFLIREAAESILTKLAGQDDVVYSNQLTAPGCGAFYGLLKGINLRGWSIADKPFFMSLDQWWSCINPTQCLGLGYAVIDGVKKIRIESRRFFYNKTMILKLNDVTGIERSYDSRYITKVVNIGFSKGLTQSGSGLDDPQTKRTLNTRFQTIGTDRSDLSSAVAASLSIEQARRNTKELTKDFQTDEDFVLIALNKSDHHSPELDENFTSITGLRHPETRYNTRLSVMRIFKRFQRFYQGCLQWYIGTDFFKFADGTGNYDMVSTLSVSDCEGDGVALSEKGGVAVTDKFDFKPIVYTFTHPLTKTEFDIIENNPNNAIGVSRFFSGHAPCHIVTVKWYPFKAKADFVVLLAGTDPIDVPQTTSTTTEPATSAPATTLEPVTTTTAPATTTEPVTTTTPETTTTTPECLQYRIVNNSDVAHLTGQYDDCDGFTQHYDIGPGGADLYVCAQGSPSIDSGEGAIFSAGECPTTTTTTPPVTTTTEPTTTTTASPVVCRSYRMQNNSDVNPAGVQYDDCDGSTQHITLGAGSSEIHCARPGTPVADPGTDVTFTDLGPC